MRILRRTFLFAAVLLSGFLSTAPGRSAEAGDEKSPEGTRRPFLWVTEGEPRIFLFGTIHIPDERVLALPDVVKQALAASDAVFTEVTPSELKAQETQARALLPAGKKIEDVLAPDALKRMHGYLESKHIPATALDRFRPWAIAVTLPLLDILPLMAAHPPMDESIFTDAKAARKEAGALETAAEQLAVFETMSDAVQSKLLLSSVDQLEAAAKEGKDRTQELIQVYLEGDDAKLRALMEEGSASDDADMKALMKRLIDDRNVTMVDRMLEEAKKRAGKTLFVAVGAAHYPGDAGVLKLLAAKGSKVRRLELKDTIAAKKPEPVPAK